MKTRTLLIAAAFLLFFCFSSFASSPESALDDFYGLYRNKEFDEASLFLNISARGGVETRITVSALSTMWDTFYNRATRVKNTREVINMNRDEIEGLKEEIEENRKEGISLEFMESLTSQLAGMKSNMRLIEALVDVEAEITGPVISKLVIDDFAIVATRAGLKFPGKYFKEIKGFVDDVRLWMPTVADKYIVLERNNLTFPVVFYLINTSGGWKLMLFSQDRFPVEQFEDFLIDFDVSFGEFQWMAGAQAQVFWEQARTDVINRKNKENQR